MTNGPSGAATSTGAAIESAFERLVGRLPTEAERARLHRVRDALGLRDNDAFWSIVMALEHYDAFFRAYPTKLADVTEKAVATVRATCAAAAREEAVAVQRALSEKVAETSVAMARKLAERPLDIHWLTAAMATAVLFGGLCVHAGYELAGPGKPFWLKELPSGSEGWRALATILSVPAGWMAFALLVPLFVQGARIGWRLATDPLGFGRERILGWTLVTTCVMTAGFCVLALIRLV